MSISKSNRCRSVSSLLFDNSWDRFVESIVREEILFQSMLASNFESEPDLRERIKSIVVEALI